MARPALRLGRLLLTAALLSLVVAACWQTDQHPVIRFENHTEVEVTVFYQNPSGEESKLQSGIGPGEAGQTSFFPTTTCTPGALIARDTSGNDIARFDGPVCRPSTWVINSPTSS